MQNILQEAQQWLISYIKSFYTEDEDTQKAILLKEEHTRKVANICRQLAEHLRLSPEDCLFAELLGWCHDAGRFEQYTKYKTFNDSVSENHAQLGLKILREVSFFARLPKPWQELFVFAIYNHNTRQIAATDDARMLLFARILRDADKLDIYRVLEPFLEPSDGSGCSEAFREYFLQGQQGEYRQIKTQDDRKLVRLLWIYDINFAWTLKNICARGYIEKIIACLPAEKAILEGKEHFYAYVEEKCRQNDEILL